MLVGNNVKIIPMEKRDSELFYKWLGSQEHIGCFMDARMEYKEPFIEEIDVLLKDKSKLYTIIEDNIGTPMGIMNYREVGMSRLLRLVY